MAAPEAVPYAQSVFAMLAVDDLHEIFSQLPVDQRLRCREVCPEWREALAYPRLWCFCDISQPDSGVAPRSVSGYLALLRTVATCASGVLAYLDVSDCGALVYDAETDSFNEQFLSFLAATPVAQLVWLSNDAVPESATLSQLFAVLPHAMQVCVNVFVRDFDVACSMLRLEPPFAALCSHYVGLELDERLQRCDWQTFAHLLQSNCAKVTRLNLIHTDLSVPEDFDCVVDAALAMGMTSVQLVRSTLDPATAAPALSRLLRGASALMRLEVRQCPYIRPLLDDEGAVFTTKLAEALRNNAQHRELTLGGIDLWRNVVVGNAIFSALSGRPPEPAGVDLVLQQRGAA